MEPSVLSFKKLSDDNFKQWRFNMQMLLAERGLWGFVSPDQEDAETPPDEKATSKELNQYRKDQQRAFATIVLGLEEEQKGLVQNCKSAKEVWDVLRSTHEPASRAIAQLRQTFLSLRLEPGENAIDVGYLDT
ncbi:uncharacterized protein LOC123322310 [Coccinella septempunctata]|uniref:uncharacterized protein LOC123322310 n=1 Tax=Coccinella septempunctata TaxID=41139 RepID=UPI001D076449|nr:uncharacterized protein LOC123322310 [Coccinella septempunctata]